MDALKDITTAYLEGQIHQDEYRVQIAALLMDEQYVSGIDLSKLASLLLQQPALTPLHRRQSL